MAIAQGATNAWAEFTSQTRAPIASTAATGDRQIFWMVWKNQSVTSSPPASNGWTKLFEYKDGTVASGVGTGSVTIACYYRTYDGTTLPGTFSFSFIPGIAAEVMQTWTKGIGETWDTPTFVTGNWTAPAASGSVTATSTTTIPNAAVVMGCLAIRNDSAVMTRGSSDGISDTTGGTVWATGLNYTESPATHLSTTTGNDMAADLGYRLVATTGGASGATLRQLATLSAIETGAAAWVVQSVTAVASGSLPPPVRRPNYGSLIQL